MADESMAREALSPLGRPATPAARRLRFMIAQLDFVVGDVRGNAERIIATLAAAREAGADVVIFPEMALCGYPPDDLLLRASFVAAAEDALGEVARHSVGLTAIVGTVERRQDLYNSAAVLHDGVIVHRVAKTYLPNYGVFDEHRYFRPGGRWTLFDRDGVCFGVTICEDVWLPSGPAHWQAVAGAEIVMNLSASPYARHKARQRERMLTTRAVDDGVFLVFCNLVGGQDEIVFDGNSLVVAPDGEILARGQSFAEDVFLVDVFPEEAFRQRLLDPRRRSIQRPTATGSLPRVALRPILRPPSAPLAPRPLPEPLVGLEAVYAALVLGVRDYARKNGFERALIGLSGGIDSALTASIAVDALGADHVLGVAMPTRHTARISVEDAQSLAANLGCQLVTIDIDSLYQHYLDILGATLPSGVSSLTAENVQPRIRGHILMALSNELGALVLTTGNKSETSVGYTTLYGDTAGGFAPLKDVPKTLVYELARWRNARQAGPWIPERSIARPPTAELKPDQTDQEVLPPYELLDPILCAYVEEEKSVAEIVAQGFDETLVRQVAAMVDRAEYKRRQSPPGVKITERAFGRERRMPITKRVNLERPTAEGRGNDEPTGGDLG